MRDWKAFLILRKKYDNKVFQIDNIMLCCCFSHKEKPPQQFFFLFINLPDDLQDYIIEFCDSKVDCRSLCRSLHQRISIHRIVNGNIGYGLYMRYFKGPWESVVAFSTIMSELKHYIDITIMHHPLHLLKHMISNHAHPSTIKRFKLIKLSYTGMVTYLPIHSRKRWVFTHIYRRRATIDYV